jgi:hypothetical protein
LAEHWKSENTESLGSLWLGLFRYYVLGFEINTYVVCIRQLAFCTRAQKKWNSKKLAIEGLYTILNVENEQEENTAAVFHTNCALSLCCVHKKMYKLLHTILK